MNILAKDQSQTTKNWSWVVQSSFWRSQNFNGPVKVLAQAPGVKKLDQTRLSNTNNIFQSDKGFYESR